MVTVFEPLDGSEPPMPTMETTACESDACQKTVTDSPGQTVVLERVISKVGRVHGVGIGRTALRRSAGAVCGETLIASKSKITARISGPPQTHTTPGAEFCGAS